MSAPKIILKNRNMTPATQSLTPEQKKLLDMIEQGGMSLFIAMVNSGAVSAEDAERVAQVYGKIRSDNSRSSALSRFARLVLER